MRQEHDKERLGCDGRSPVTVQQERMWFLHEASACPERLHLPLTLRWFGELRAGVLRDCVQVLVARHGSLRTRFGRDESGPFQICEGAVPVELPIVEAGECDADRVREVVRAPFHLTRAPLWRALLVRHAADHHEVLFVFHHIIADGWSLRLFVRELLASYDLAVDGGAAQLPRVRASVDELATAQRSWLTTAAAARHRRYWRRQLEGGIGRATFTPDLAPSSASAGTAGVARSVVGAAAWDALRSAARRLGVTAFEFLLATWFALLRRHSDKTDLVVGCPVVLRSAESRDLFGLLLNTLAIRVRLREDEPFRALVRRVARAVRRARSHRMLPFETVIEDLGGSRTHDRAPFATFFNLLAFGERRTDRGRYRIEAELDLAAGARFDVELYAEPVAAELELALVHHLSRYSARCGDELLRQYLQLVAAFVADAEVATGAPSLVTSVARPVLPELEAFRVVPAAPSLLRRIVDRALQQPAAAAVDGGQDIWCYGELESRSRGLAAALRGAGIGRGDVVAIAARRTPTLVPAVLGVMRSGAAFWILDPEAPAQAVARQARQARPRMLLAIESDAHRFERICDRTWLLPRSGGAWPSGAVDDAASIDQADIDDLACLVFTSGSTGTPKAVEGTHGGLTAMLRWQTERFGFAARDRFSMLSALAQDPLQRDVFTSLWAGATLMVPEPAVFETPGAMAAWLQRRAVTVANMTPALGRFALLASATAAAEARLPALRCLFFVGEPLPVAALRDWRRAAPQATLVNLYGATETQRALTHWILPPDDPVPNPPSGVAPLAGATSGVELLVLNDHGALAGLGECGEIHVRSRYLARGYRDDPELTERRFRADPCCGDARIRIYRTGDRGRYGSDGTVEYGGRRDRQLKVRGFRVEPEEVERALSGLPGVREATVEPVADGDGSVMLVAFVVADAPERVGHWRRALESELGSAAMPTRFVLLDSMPRSRSGKVDRRALSAYRDHGDAGAAQPGPATPSEVRLARVWCEVLGVDAVGPSASFFELGGHSLRAMDLLARIRRDWGREVSLRAFLDGPTVHELAQLLEDGAQENAGAATAQFEPSSASRYEPFPLTDLQQAYWIGRRLDGALGNVGSHAYYEIDFARLDVAGLADAWLRLVERHDMLRAVVHPNGQQQVLPRVEPYRIAVDDVRAFDPGAVERHLRVVREDMSHRVFDAATWPLFELRVSRIRDDLVRLHVSFDFLIADASSWGVLLPELARLYDDPRTSLPPLQLTFRDYVVAVVASRATARHARDVGYWQRRAASLPPPPELPIARTVNQIQRPRFHRRSFVLSPASWRQVKLRAAGRALTPAALLLALYADVLALWASGSEFVIHVTRFDRRPVHPQVNAILGDFTALTLLAVQRDRAATFAQHATALQQQLWRDLDHGTVSGVRVWAESAGRRGARGLLAALPVVFTSKLGLDDPRQRNDAWPGDGRLVYGLSQTPQVCLDFQVAERSDGALLCDWDAVDALFPDGLLASMLASCCDALQRLVESAAWDRTRLVEIPAADLQPRRIANATAAPMPAGRLHEPFLERARRAPHAVAAVTAQRVMTYGELAARARAVTHWLSAGGAQRAQLVAVVMYKGWEQLVAAIGVLDSGAAYLPVDASLPPRRIDQLLRSGDASLILTQRAVLRDAAWHGTQRIVCVDELTPQDELPPVGAATGGCPEDLAYVMFTSGSTGEPQGVMIEHRAALNTIVDMNRRFRVDSDDRVLAISSMSFDLSVYDVFGLLAAGGAVVLPGPEDLREPAAWLALLERQRVTVWNSVPALLQLLVDYMRPRGLRLPASVRLVLLSGDWIPVTLPDQVKALAQNQAIQCISLGGATEAAIWSVYHVIREVDTGATSIPYGRPLANQGAHVLDDDFHPCPDFKAGELFLGGTGLARGYWRNAPKTEQRFVRHPISGERLYRTGDLARYLPDGELELLGRTDLQVKIQGFRIELGEVERVLGSHPAIASAIATAEGDRGAARRLLAYYVPSPAVAITEGELRAFLRERLPEHMVPARICAVASWPLSSNGKVDRRALPAPCVDRAPPNGEMTPSAMQQQVRAVFAAVLQRPELALADGFFEQGATSLHVVEAHARLAIGLGRDFPMTAIFRHPTVASLAAYLEGGGAPNPDPVEAARVSAVRRRQRPDRRRKE